LATTYAGLRVLDLSENIAGPLTCMILADLGAGVIKVKRRSTGEATRSLPPRWGPESSVFLTVNRNNGTRFLLLPDASADVVGVAGVAG
jgi:crotonobetainyl-CoA:carnitine CoA-transferase CaiB-like acyl-CoA transferase